MSKPRSDLKSKDLHRDDEDQEAEVEGDATQTQRWDEAAQQLQRRVGHRVDQLEQEHDGAGRAPVPREHEHIVENQPGEEQEEHNLADGLNNRADNGHVEESALVEEAALSD